MLVERVPGKRVIHTTEEPGRRVILQGVRSESTSQPAMSGTAEPRERGLSSSAKRLERMKLRYARLRRMLGARVGPAGRELAATHALAAEVRRFVMVTDARERGTETIPHCATRCTSRNSSGRRRSRPCPKKQSTPSKITAASA